MRPTRILRKLGLSLTLMVGLLFLVEGAVRLRQKQRYGTTGDIYRFAEHEPTGLWIPVPGSRTDTISIDSLGFRGPELAPPSDEVVRLAFLGGSTTYCAEVSDNDATWPARVTAHLAERFAPRRFDYVNAGVGAYTLRESLQNLEGRVGPLEPDVVVVYHASNDLTKNSRPLAREQDVYRGHADRPSWLAEHSLAYDLLVKNLLVRLRKRAVERAEVRPLTLDEATLARLVEPYRADLVALVRSARELGARVCLVTFSHRARPEMSREELLAANETSLYYMPYMTPELLLEAFGAYNDVAREVAAAEGCLLVEGALAVPADGEHFNDSIHFKDAGAEALAGAVSAALATDPAFAERVAP